MASETRIHPDYGSEGGGLLLLLAHFVMMMIKRSRFLCATYDNLSTGDTFATCKGR